MISDIFYEIGVSIASGDLFIPAIIVMLGFIGILIFSRFPKAGGILVFGLAGLAFSQILPIHEAFRFIYFGALVVSGIVIALLIWKIFSS